MLQSIYQYSTGEVTKRLSLFFFFLGSRPPGKGQRFGILQLLEAQTLDVPDPLTTHLRLYPPPEKDVFSQGYTQGNMKPGCEYYSADQKGPRRSLTRDGKGNS